MKKALSFHHGICSVGMAEDQRQQRPSSFLPDIRCHKHHTSATQHTGATVQHQVQGQRVRGGGGGETRVKGEIPSKLLNSRSRRDTEEGEGAYILGLKAQQFADVMFGLLDGLTREGDRLPYDPRHQLITRFHQRQPPAVSVRKYLERIMKYCHCSDECYVLALVYLDRIVHKNPSFFISSHNVHRLLITRYISLSLYLSLIWFPFLHTYSYSHVMATI